MSGSSKPEAEKKAVETFGELCTQLENDLGVQIPTYIKNILVTSGFNNRATLRSLSESDINSLESFARGEVYIYQKKNTSWDKWYGIYAPKGDCKKFKIPIGHRRLLLCIADYLQQN